MLRISGPSENHAERSYVLDVVLRGWFGLEFSLEPNAEMSTTTIEIDGQSGTLTVAESVLLADLERARDLRIVSRHAWVDTGPIGSTTELLGSSLPVLYGPKPSTVVTPESSSVDALKIEIDVFGTIFALLTGLEDRFITERDEHDRIPMASTLLHHRDLIEHPVVDELAELLLAAITVLWPQLPVVRRDSMVRVTQDVDRLAKYGRATAVDVALAGAAGLRRGGPGEALRSFRGGVQARLRGIEHDPHYTFDRFMDLVEKHGHIASFNFICRYDSADGTRLGHYDISEPAASQVLRKIFDRGHEVGLHPSYRSHLDTEALRADAAALRAAVAAVGQDLPIVGGRHHYLRWDSHRSPGCWQDAELAYDSSLGFAERAGFRVGTSKPFPLWDHQRRQPTDVEERPLVFMDASLPAMGLSAFDDATADRLLALRRQCERYNGDFTLLIHNEDFSLPGALELADAILG